MGEVAVRKEDWAHGCFLPNLHLTPLPERDGKDLSRDVLSGACRAHPFPHSMMIGARLSLLLEMEKGRDSPEHDHLLYNL